jgi:translation initiation factor IF-2
MKDDPNAKPRVAVKSNVAPAQTDESSYDPRTNVPTGKPVSRREVIEVRELVRQKPFGKKRPIPGRRMVATAVVKQGTEAQQPQKAVKRTVKISGSITISDLAKGLAVKANELIAKAMGMGMMVTMNQSVDLDTATLLAQEFGHEAENVAVDAEEMLVDQQPAVAGDLKPRPPVVTIMGHVDHGKTSLLDYIRKTNVTKKEFGGITQHIGAYDVKHTKGHIIFLDTPGHEAFTAMRARGASVTDIVVLVVAADDGVMPQTRESINHAKAAKVPIIVAINKMDKPGADPERIKKDLTEFALVPEAWGGDTIFVPVSAKSGLGINDLLDMILLQADVMQLKADPKKLAKGTIIESKLDRGRGVVATVMIQEGTLRVGDPIVCGNEFGKVRTLINDIGERVKEAGPSIPVEVVGLSGIVQVGDVLHVLSDEKKVREIAQVRQERQRTKDLEKNSKVTLDQLYNQIEKGEIKDFKVVVKGDVMGSVEAINESLKKLTTDKVSISIIHSAVGGISESDVMLASASKALIIGFNVRPDAMVQQLAEKQVVEIRLYTIIYDMMEEIKKAMSGMLAPKNVEQVIGHMLIKETFNITKVGTIGGGTVTDGRIARSAKVRVLRDSVPIYDGTLSSLKHFKDDAREVKSGSDCGLGIANFNDIKVGDVIEAYEITQVSQQL